MRESVGHCMKRKSIWTWVLAIAVGLLFVWAIPLPGQDSDRESIGPALTTVTDRCGCFFSLGFATLMLQNLAS